MYCVVYSQKARGIYTALNAIMSIIIIIKAPLTAGKNAFLLYRIDIVIALSRLTVTTHPSDNVSY